MSNYPNYYVSGETGFLMKHMLPYFEANIYSFTKDNLYYTELNDINTVIHFASPSDSFDFQNKYLMSKSMIDLTQDMLKCAIDHNAKFIFASTEAAIDPVDTYGFYKRAMEDYILSIHPNSLILRIPRVYGTDKTKGLMKKINDGFINKEDIYKEIEYIDIQDYIKWFFKVQNEVGIVEYNLPKRKNTIQEIAKLYCDKEI